MATKALRVQLADILGDIGPASGATGEVWARYVDATGPRPIRYTDGTLVLPLPRRVAVPSSGIVDLTVVPNDDTDVLAADHGFGVEVGWDIKVRGEHGRPQTLTGSGVVAVTSADTAPVLFALEADFAPVVGGIGGGSGSLTVVSGPTPLNEAAAVGTMLGFVVTAATTIGDIAVTVGTWVFVKEPGGWVGYQASGGVGGDETPPTALTSVAISAITGSTATASWAAATDPDSAVTYRWRVYPTGSPSGAYASTSGLSVNLTGLTPATSYTVAVYSESGGGSTAPVTQAFTTGLPSGVYGPLAIGDGVDHRWAFAEPSGTTVDDAVGSWDLTLASITLGAAGIGDEATCAASEAVDAVATYTAVNIGAASNTFALEGILTWNANGSYGTGIYTGVNGWIFVSLPFVASGPRQMQFQWKKTDGTDFLVQTGLILAEDTRFHFACVQEGTEQRILINGAVVVTGVTSGNAADPGSGTQKLLDRWNGKAAGLHAYIGAVPTNAEFLEHAQAAGLA